jgi:hypothetical protein
MRSLIAVFVGLVCGMSSASAYQCQVFGPSYRFQGETLDWTMSIGSGPSCDRAFRVRGGSFASVRILDAAKVGRVTTRGSGFAYEAKPDFIGEDFFILRLTGIRHGWLPGTTTIRVRVKVN